MSDYTIKTTDKQDATLQSIADRTNVSLQANYEAAKASVEAQNAKLAADKKPLLSLPEKPSAVTKADILIGRVSALLESCCNEERRQKIRDFEKTLA